MKYLVRVRRTFMDYIAVEFTNKADAQDYCFFMNRRGYFTKITKVE